MVCDVKKVAIVFCLAPKFTFSKLGVASYLKVTFCTFVCIHIFTRLESSTIPYAFATRM